MSELTNTMQPVCVGRFVIEIPTVAKIESWRQEVLDTKIETISPPSLNRNVFDAKVRQIDTKLHISPHKTDGVRLKSKIQLTTESVLFVYRENATDISGYELEAFFWKPEIEYKFNVSSTNKYLNETIADISKAVKSFIAMPNKELLGGPPGFCIENGVFTDMDTGFRGEDVYITGRIKEYPGLEFKFSTQATNRPDQDKTLIERIDNSFGLGDAMGKTMTASTKFKRKGKRTLNGQKGEEFVAFVNIDGKKTIDATAEFYGEPNVLEKPYMQIELTYNPENVPYQAPKGKAISDKDFMALWDALLNGIKPRTSSLWGNGSIKK